ncbi:right-handed parallel beta-helix repeat-containing protein [Faecalibacterium sp. I4-3-84]|uniref:right-handed parallel beta-helix repeat-containing protein n=1 Tax=Faecalibacterium sp. I4-3-84 TaxID=2929495 RepID=UPI0020148D43|nr:right-handed parallel beta-helix repeat-containing protein [Faecalibacterium sp. I4-3-84]UQK38652.1 right-handed parallel beta-helix repeat-containing protein [Faecalibacterium sp. I4-3-84]
MTGAVTVNNGNRLTIDLNGHTLTAAANSQAFRIQNGALTIEDSGSTGVIQGSGTVTGNGGAIWMSSNDSNNALTLTGGTIRGFTATDGGGVYVSGGSFEMSGGTISACNAANAGGGVYVSSGSFEMSGGSIENCTAHEGAGVKVLASSGKASFSMSGSGEIKNCNQDGVSIAAIGGTSEFSMSGGTIEDNSGFGVWVDNGSAVMSGGSVKGSERYDIYIGSRAALTVKNTQVGGTVLNLGKITGQGSAEFTGTVENSGYAVAEITGCKIHRIEHRSPYKGTITDSPCDEYVYLLGRSWKIPSGAGESITLKVSSYLPPVMENSLEIPKGVTVTVDLAGKTLSAKESDFKIINHGTLTLIDSSTGGTLSIPIENDDDGVLNANGGTVTSEVTNKGTIQATGTPVTQFTGTLVNQEGASVTAGDFRGCMITNNGGTIGGGAIWDNPEHDPEQPGAGSEDGGAGAVIAALAVGTVVVGGGILLAHSYIQNNLPEGFAVPETRQELAVVLWNMAGKPEPASQQTYTDVQDEEVLKAVCWAVENELVTPETESTLGADVRVNRLQVIGAMYQTNKRKK